VQAVQLRIEDLRQDQILNAVRSLASKTSLALVGWDDRKMLWVDYRLLSNPAVVFRSLDFRVERTPLTDEHLELLERKAGWVRSNTASTSPSRT
jgi:hypothetical protein